MKSPTLKNLVCEELIKVNKAHRKMYFENICLEEQDVTSRNLSKKTIVLQ